LAASFIDPAFAIAMVYLSCARVICLPPCTLYQADISDPPGVKHLFKIIFIYISFFSKFRNKHIPVGTVFFFNELNRISGI